MMPEYFRERVVGVTQAATRVQICQIECVLSGGREERGKLRQNKDVMRAMYKDLGSLGG